MARLIFSDFTAFTLGGETKYLANLRNFEEDPGPEYADGGGFAGGYDKDVLVKLNHTIPFEVQLSGLQADATLGGDEGSLDDIEMTNLCVTKWEMPDGTNRIADLRSASWTVEAVTKEGSGVADLRRLPVRVKRRYSGSASLLMNTTDNDVPFVQDMSDQGTVADIMSSSSAFYQSHQFTIRDPSGTPADVLDWVGNVAIRPKHVVTHEDIQMVNIDWTGRGAPGTATGKGIIATACGASQPLITLVWTVGTDTISTATVTSGAFINRLTVNVQDAAIIGMNGLLTIVTEPTFS